MPVQSLKTLSLTAAAIVTLSLAACETSGYTQMAGVSSRPTLTADLGLTDANVNNLDREVEALLSIESKVYLPARIGLAKITHGRLTQPSEAELFEWNALQARLGAGFGDFFAVNPASATAARSLVGGAQQGVEGDIRRAAALQKLDYVLAYETSATSRADQNALSITDWTIVGLWLSPSRSVEAQATAQAVMMDVRTGTILGVAQARGEADRLARAVDASENRRKAAGEAIDDAVAALIPEVEGLARGLMAVAEPWPAARTETATDTE